MNTAVYYPYFNPPLAWLKVASLCWDKVFVLETTRPLIGGVRTEKSEIASFERIVGSVIDRSTFVGALVDTEIIDKFKSWVEASNARLRAAGMEIDPEAVFALHDTKFTTGGPEAEQLRGWLIE